MKKIETRGTQMFTVPNTEEGQHFLRLLDKYINRPHWLFRRRGRGPRPRSPGYYKPDETFVSLGDRMALSPSHENCKWVAVYINPGDRGKANKAHQKYCEHLAAQVFESFHHDPTPVETVELTEDELRFLDKAVEVFALGQDKPEDVLGITEDETDELIISIRNKLFD